jgi:hypothetical protein
MIAFNTVQRLVYHDVCKMVADAPWSMGDGRVRESDFLDCTSVGELIDLMCDQGFAESEAAQFILDAIIEYN